MLPFTTPIDSSNVRSAVIFCAKLVGVRAIRLIRRYGRMGSSMRRCCRRCRRLCSVRRAENFSIRKTIIASFHGSRPTKVEKEYTKALNFSQWVRAFPLIGDKKIAYWGIWHTYNDFLRSGDKASYDRLRNVFVLYASKFIDELDSTRDKDRLFKAELCREIGRFDRCVELLDCKQFPDNMKSFVDKVKQAALRKDRVLFKVFEPQKK